MVVKMKIAISGKLGVDKTLLTAILAKIFTESGYSVLAIDADPDVNLATTLGFTHPKRITPISEMKALIEQRAGGEPGQLLFYHRHLHNVIALLLS